MPIRYMTRIAILSALCVVLRFAFSSLPNVQPITAIFLVSSIILGITDAILMMAITMLVTGFLLGFTPVVFWQIFSFSVILLLWRYLFYPVTKWFKFDRMKSNQISIELGMQSFFTGVLGFLYGVQIDFVYAFIYKMPLWTYIGAGFTFNLAHAVSTVIFYPIIYSIMLSLKKRSSK